MFFTFCKYHDVTKTVNCSNINIGTMQIQNVSVDSLKVERLHLKNASLTMLEANVFRSVPKLWYLDISNNFLETLDYRLFSKLTKLLQLDLTNNRLTSLRDERLFKSQARLSTLLLGNNEIRVLDLVVIIPLNSIRVLNLTGNPFICSSEFSQLELWWTERVLDTGATCTHANASSWSSLNSSGIYDRTYTTSISTEKVEEHEMTTAVVSSELLVTEGNVELSTGRIGGVSRTEDNKEGSVLKTEENDDSVTEEYSGVSVTKEIGRVSISEADVEESTTKRSSRDSSNTATFPVTALIVCACVAVLLSVCLLTSFCYWRKLRIAHGSENAHSANFHGRLGENNESDAAIAVRLSLSSCQAGSLLQGETSISAEMELLQRGTPEAATKETAV
jgi:hypothetical protein